MSIKGEKHLTRSKLLGGSILIMGPAVMRTVVIAVITVFCLAVMPPNATADVLTKVGTFNAIGGSGDQSITGVGFQPKAVLFWYTDRSVAGVGRYARMGQGWATGPSNQGSVSTAWSDGEGNPSNMRSSTSVMDSKAILVQDHYHNVIGAAELESMDSDGFTLEWGWMGGTGDSRLIIYLALGGSSLMAEAGGETIPANTSGSTYDINVGFQPDVVFMAGVEDLDQFYYSSRGGYGFGVGMSSSKRYSSAHRWRDRKDGGYSSSGIVNDEILIYADDTTTPEDSYDLVSMRTDGFRLRRTGAGEVSTVIYLALAGLDVDIGMLTEPWSPDTRTVSGLSFEPSAVIFHGGNTNFVGFDVYAHYIAGVASDPTNQASVWAGCDYDNSDTAISTSEAIISYDADSSSPNSRAYLQSMNADGFTLDWVQAHTSSKIGWIALGGSGASVFSASPSSMNMMVGESENGTASGGTSPYSAVSSDPSVATVSVVGNTFTVNAVAIGSATITVSDSSGESAEVAVTVSELMTVTPTHLNLFPTQIATVYINGGTPGFTVVSGNPDVATASVTGTEITLVGVAAGAMTVTVTDASDNHVFITVNVGDSIAPGLGACPIPPFAANVMSPNVLLIFDTSGSMDDDDGDGVTRFEEARDAMLAFLAANKNIRFGLMRIDGTPWEDGGRPGGVVGEHNAIKGGRLLVPTGYTGSFATSADYIIDYINTHMSGKQPDWRDDTGARHWTNLAETLVDAGRYFATVVDSDDNRVGKGPAGFGYYKEGTDYTFYYNKTDLNPYLASITDDHGNAINSISPLQHSCEQAFVIMFTDGQANCDNDWDIVTDLIGDYDGDGDPRDCKRADPEVIRPGISDPGNGQYGKPLPTANYPCDTRDDPDDDTEDGKVNYLDDVAKYLFDNDLRSDIPGKQNLITYTIGFYLDDQDLLQDTAANGGGQHFTANSIDELTDALQTAMEDIMLRVASGTAVSTITTASHSDDYLVRAKFFPGSSWKGYLERHNLSNPDFSTPDWEAAALLNARVAGSGYADRDIYTFMDSQSPHKQEFTDADGPVKTRMKTLWSETTDETEDIINYIRGDQTYDGVKYKARNGWLLGDIIYSTPTAVGAPQGWYFDRTGVDDPPEYSTYQDFKNAHADRKVMVYVGANDGMLHAFDADNGHEDWAFIPEHIQAKLEELTVTDCHKYFVDLTPYVTDAWDETEGVSGEWKTILIGGNRFGGEEYFALDVTDPSAAGFEAMWDEIPFVGQGILSSTVPVVGKVQADSKAVDHWVAIITSGYHGASEKGRITALKISDGSKVDIWENPNYGDDDDDDDDDDDEDNPYSDDMETQRKESRIAGSPYYTMSSPAALDTDLDGYLDVIYAGDTEGSLWKFYYDYEDDMWKKFEMFNTGGKAITASPALAFDPDGKLRIYFGTGKYLEESDKANSTRNAFYCLVDEMETSGSAGDNKGHYTRTVNLTGQLIDITDWDKTSEFYDDANLVPADRDTVSSKGWYFLLDPVGSNPAERILGKALVVSGTVFVTSFAPNDDICGGGGDSRLYAFNYITGVTDADGEPVLSNYATGKRYADIGHGVPSVPVYYFNPATKTSSVIIQKSDSQVVKEDPTLKERPMAIQSWRAK